MAPLTPTGLLSGAQQVSSLHVSSLPTIPSPTTPRRSSCLARFCNRTYRRGESQDPSHPLRQGIANVNWASPRTRRLAATTGRIEFVILRTDCSPSDALHLPSQGRSSGRLRDPSQAPTGTSTLLVRYTYDRTCPRTSVRGFSSWMTQPDQSHATDLRPALTSGRPGGRGSHGAGSPVAP